MPYQITRQNALSNVQWIEVLMKVIAPVPEPSEAVIWEDSDTESDAGWYPEDIETGVF